MKKAVCLIMSLLIPFLVSISAQQDEEFNCFTILVGKNASADGSVLLGHNEDNSGDVYADWYGAGSFAFWAS